MCGEDCLITTLNQVLLKRPGHNNGVNPSRYSGCIAHVE
jgi:hypothetical protein